MNPDLVKLTQDALWLVVALSGPPIAVATGLGLLVAFLQAVTQIQEQTLALLVKLIAIAGTLALMAGLMFTTLIRFAERVFTAIPAGGM